MAYKLYEVIAEHKLPAIFHSGHSGIGTGMPGGGGMRLKYSNPIHVDDVAVDFPDMKIIIAHPSWPWQDEALSVCLHKPNVYIDLSGWSPKYFPPQLVQYANGAAEAQDAVRLRLPADRAGPLDQGFQGGGLQARGARADPEAQRDGRAGAGRVTAALEPEFEAQVRVGPPVTVGEAPAGLRRVVPILGGSFAGRRFSGEILPGGADWQVSRRDGVTELEALYLLRTHDGVVVQVRNCGLRHGPPDVMARLAAGEAVSPDDYYFRTSTLLSAPTGAYDWLNRSVFVSEGARHPDSVVVKFYRLA